MLDINSKLCFSAIIEVLRFLERHLISVRFVCQGSYTQKSGRQVITSLSIFDDKYYIYYQGKYVKNPTGSSKISIFSSIVLIDWSTNHPVELIHQHVDNLKDIFSFIDSLKSFVEVK